MVGRTKLGVNFGINHQGSSFAPKEMGLQPKNLRKVPNMRKILRIGRGLEAGVLACLLIWGFGCKRQPAGTAEQPAPVQPQSAPQPVQPPQPDDQQIAKSVRAKIKEQAALNGQRVHLNVANGIVTLNGKVDNDASRALAAADAGSVYGVRTVVNNLLVAPAKAANPPKRHRETIAQASPPAPPPPPPPTTDQTPPPPPPPQPAVPATPAPPPPPPVKTVTVPAGTVIPVRMIDSLDSGTTQSNTTFQASLATDLIVDGMVAAPRGTKVIGRVITAKDATHFSGSSELSIELTKMFTNRQEISLVTDSYTKQGAGRGKNTAVKSGAGAAFGAILGALAGGGKGAAIGAATGGGIGAGVNGVTRGQQVQIPSETLVNFNLQSPISITTSRVARGSEPSNSDDRPELHRLQQ
jgi:hypothetical protein